MSSQLQPELICRPLDSIDVGRCQFPDSPLLPGLDPPENTPDETWLVVDRQKIVACASLWQTAAPCYREQSTAVAGHFFAAAKEAGVLLLEQLKQRAARRGAAYLIGPMDGDTWHRYRLVSRPNKTLPFLFDLETPLWWNEIFQLAGFTAVKRYHSSVGRPGAYSDRSVTRFTERMQAMKLRVRTFDPEHWQEELSRLHPLCCRCFSNNFLYTDITLETFLHMYKPVLNILDPDFFLIAEDDGEPVGFVFGYPNRVPHGDGAVESLVLKTVARLPGRLYAGLGACLVHEFHTRAETHGYKQIVHAFMAAGNASAVISKKSTGVTVCEYLLYGCPLR